VRRNPYAKERAYVSLMMWTIGGLLQAASAQDAVLAEEVAGFPEGMVIAMSIFGDRLRLRLRVTGGVFQRLPERDPASADLEIVFKHLAHAFLVLSFQEATARAIANDRMITRGDTALAMRFVRCLNRLEAVVLPRLVAERALKRYPALPLAQKLPLAARVYTRLVLDSLPGRR
jgi:hypothetical protein